MHTKLALFSALSLLFACQPNDHETIETFDEQGHIKERFVRRKADFAKNGLYQRFAPDGHYVEEAMFRNDTLDGERKFFYPNGKVEIIEPNRNGVIHGKYRKFFENGSIALEQDYVNGVLEGESLAWYPNGMLKERVSFQKNEENGPFKEWHPNGQPKTEGNYLTPDDPDFSGDREEGELRMYDSLGQLERIMDCRLGVCRTKWARDGN